MRTAEPAPANGRRPGPAGKARRVLLNLLFWLVIPVGAVLLVHTYVLSAYNVTGRSMAPNLHDSDYVLISKAGQTGASLGRLADKDMSYIPKRGDIVVFRYPRDPSRVFVKRVIALPGERVVIEDGTVRVFNARNPDGFDPDTDYESRGTSTLIDTDVTVRKGAVFVIGDNRSADGSYDSRDWGDLNTKYIIGTAELRLLPLTKIKFL